MNASTDLAPTEAPEDLVAWTKQNEADEDIVFPVIQVTQGLSDAVTDGEVEAGHFYNALTGDDYGTEINLVVVYRYKGRFLPAKESDDDKSYVASGPVAPSNWPEKYRGRAFVEIEDAEEQFREDVNADLREWGEGPPIRTTYNYIGLRPEQPELPVRLSLMRTSAPAAKNLNTLLRLERQYWNRAFLLSTEERRNKANKPYFIVKTKPGPDTTPEVRQTAVQLAQAVRDVDLDSTAVPEQDEPSKRTKAPDKPEGAVEIS